MYMKFNVLRNLLHCAQVSKRKKNQFFHNFFKIRKKWSNLYMQYVYGKVLKCKKQHFCPFLKMMKIELNRGKSMKMSKKAYSVFVQ